MIIVHTLREHPSSSVFDSFALHSEGRQANGHLRRDHRRACADRQLCNQRDTSAHVGDLPAARTIEPLIEQQARWNAGF